MATYNLFVKLLDGKTLNLRVSTPSISGESIKNLLHHATGIHTDHQILLADGRSVSGTAVISAGGTTLFPTVHLLLRLLGGKGGFGSLLRGAATKAGQKKTNNFDACRDMSGRRLRHVNAEKKLEEWQAEAENRQLEKIAEQFLKKNAKKGKKSGTTDAEKYVEKYREESAKCVEVVEASVRESLEIYKNSKRKAASSATKSESKKLKIWMGKQKLEDSDSDDMDEDDSGEDDKEEEIEKSVVLDGGNLLDASMGADGSSSSVSCGKANKACSPGGSCESGSEGEKETVMQGASELCGSPTKLEHHDEVNGALEPCAEAMVFKGTDAIHRETSSPHDRKPADMDDCQLGSSSCLGAISDVEIKETSATEDIDVVLATNDNEDMDKPLNFDDFSSASEMEALGLERLKTELQSRGIKCGGTLQERAARLFLLKTTPLQQLPKKLLAKK